MHEPPEKATLPAVVEQGYAAWMWLDGRVASMPVSARRQLGHRMIDAVLDALVAATQAAYLPRGPARLRELHAASRSLAVLRILLRGCRERRYLSIDQHEHAMKLVDDWGRQLGGWIRHDAGVQHGR